MCIRDRTCTITALLIPGEDEEDTEVFRQRYFNSLNAQAFGGNRIDYIEKVNEMCIRDRIPVRTLPAKEYWKFWKDRVISINTATLQEFELDSDFWGSNKSYERELIGDTSLTRRLYARQLCGLYNPNRYKAFRELVESTEDRLLVFYNFTEEMERMKGIVKAMNRPVSILSGEVKDLGAYNFHSNSVTFIQYQAGAMGGNFQKANKIIYFSLPQGWELWEQSQKRIHRIGQDRPCFYYWMICPGTVEEDIYSTLQMRKDYNDELFRKYEDSPVSYTHLDVYKRQHGDLGPVNIPRITVIFSQ